MWIYEDAFVRNRGLISPEEQQILRRARVAIAGLGGVGGIDLVALARLGIGYFTIADPDVFEISNTNRQYGALISNVGKNKADVMAAVIRDINPEADIRLFKDPIQAGNVDAFLDGADVLVDGIDAFEIDVRRLVFGKAREKKIYGVGAGPIGFSTVWVNFSPEGWSFEKYFDFSDHMGPLEKFAAYVLGMAPSATQRHYMDLSYVNVTKHQGPSTSLACHLASGVVAAEVVKIILKRGKVFAAPYYHQFDAYLGKMIRRRLIWGNRGPLQKFKQQWLCNALRKIEEDRSRSILP